MDGLFDALKSAGKDTVVLKDKVMVLPFGGRVIGLYPEADLNAFWVNKGLLSKDTSAGFFAGEGWLNMDGERSWISPEVEVNIADPSSESDEEDYPGDVDLE